MVRQLTLHRTCDSGRYGDHHVGGFAFSVQFPFATPIVTGILLIQVFPNSEHGRSSHSATVWELYPAIGLNTYGGLSWFTWALVANTW
jgi:hypothetical protein